MSAGGHCGGYIGRFAPSPTGPLHEGSLVAALASWLDARAHGGKWLVRIEDVDTPRCVPGADQLILQQLAACGLHPDEPPVYQSQRASLYQTALDTLIEKGLAYPCACTRQDIALALAARGQVKERHGELVYPGTCRQGLKGRPARAWRFLTETSAGAETEIHWCDRLLGDQRQSVSREVGDFILKRADGLWAYQLAVVVDDAEQGITDVVRGEDLADNTARQILLQRALGYSQPRYMHTPLVLAADGRKLSKQNGARALDVGNPLALLEYAGKALGLQVRPATAPVKEWLATATKIWQQALQAGTLK
ncbi:MAG: tRNA glutamyl-Q(34) synthetase GluQRS [Pseudomonadota bacterium]